MKEEHPVREKNMRNLNMEEIMKRVIVLLFTVLLMLRANGVKAETSEFNPDWNLPETIGMTDEIADLFNTATEGIDGVGYEALGFLGEKDGIYCILCRATVVYPGAAPYYALVYITGNGVQNIWEIWMDAHSKPKD